jgi:hypothetical protein
MYLTDFAAWACKRVREVWPSSKLRNFEANLRCLGQYRYGSLCSGMDAGSSAAKAGLANT